MYPPEQRGLLLGKAGNVAALGGLTAASVMSNQASRSRLDPGETLPPRERGGSGEYGSEPT
jgi:hypothetical protein